jgi:hypothetical protein
MGSILKLFNCLDANPRLFAFVIAAMSAIQVALILYSVQRMF